LGEFECLNAPAAAAKRVLIVLSAAGLENGLCDFTTSARSAPERESVLALSAAVQAPFKPGHNQTQGDHRSGAGVLGSVTM
jgi:hypothetical protein